MKILSLVVAILLCQTVVAQVNVSSVNSLALLQSYNTNDVQTNVFVRGYGIFEWNGNDSTATNAFSTFASPFGAATGRWDFVTWPVLTNIVSTNAIAPPTNTVVGNLTAGIVPKASGATNLADGPVTILSVTNAALLGNLTANGGAFTNLLTLNGQGVLTNSVNAPTNTITGSTPLTTQIVPKIDSSGTNLVNGPITISAVTNAALLGNFTANGGAFTNSLTLNGQTVLTNATSAPTNTITGSTPLTSQIVPKIDSSGTNLVNSSITISSVTNASLTGIISANGAVFTNGITQVSTTSLSTIAGPLQVHGASLAYHAVGAANYTATTNDCEIVIDGNTLTLPNTTNAPAGFFMIIFNNDGAANSTTVQPQASDDIFGHAQGASSSLPPGIEVIIISNGAGNWFGSKGSTF